MTLVTFIVGVAVLVGSLVTGHPNAAIVGVAIMATAAFFGQLGAWH